jgi:hypothetical protein
MTNINTFSQISTPLYNKYGITQVKNLLKEGFSPLEVSEKIKEMSLTDVEQIIHQYKPARRWAAYHGFSLSEKSIDEIFEQFPPDFSYLLKIRNRISSKVKNGRFKRTS